MKITYDAETDVLTIELRDGPVATTEEEKSGVLLDYDDRDRLIAIELLDASQRVSEVDAVRLQILPKPPGSRPKAAE